MSTTMIYTHVARNWPAAVPSPLEGFGEVSADDARAAVAATRRLTGPTNRH